MPYTFNGCGTRLYGRRDVGEDGSYITTEWITLVYVPLIPIKSQRIWPKPGGTNVLIYRSSEYQAVRAPLCWPQVRNVYCFTGPILALILFFSWGDLTTWAKSSWVDFQPLRVQAAPPDVVLDGASAAVACGNMMKLEQPAFEKFDIHNRMAGLVKNGNFTAEELKNISDENELENDAFGAYSVGYLSWNHPVDPTRSNLGNKMIGTINVESGKLTGDDEKIAKDYGRKMLTMLMTSFDMGRHDARTSPCDR